MPERVSWGIRAFALLHTDKVAYLMHYSFRMEIHVLFSVLSLVANMVAPLVFITW